MTMTPMLLTGAQLAPINRDALALFKLINEQAAAIKRHNLDRAAEIEREMIQKFSGWPCLECGCEAYLHTPESCAKTLEGGANCPCTGLRLEVTDANVGGVPASELFGEDLFAGADYVSIVTRAQLIANGDLVDVTKVAKKAGIKFPVAMTKAAWGNCVEWTDADKARKRSAYQDESGRLWDVLTQLAYAAAAADGQRITFKVLRVPRDGEGLKPKLVTLKAVMHAGDEGEAVITVMEPLES